MIRFLPLSCLFALVIVPSFGDELADNTVTLDQLSLDLGNLKEWGTKQYTYSLVQPDGTSDEVLGKLVLSTKVEENAIILNDEIAITYKGKRLSGTITLHCRKDNNLSPTTIESQGEGDDEFGAFVATVDKGKAVVRKNGTETTIELPEDTVSTEALMRLVTLIPRKKGTRISFGHSLETSELNLKKDFLLESLGEDTIARGDQEIRCTKFQLTSRQIRPMLFWVKDGVLERMLFDNRKLIDRQIEEGIELTPDKS